MQIYTQQTEANITCSSAVHNSCIIDAKTCTKAAGSPCCGFGAANDKCCAEAEIKGMYDDSLWANVSAFTLRTDGCDISLSGLGGRPMDI